MENEDPQANSSASSEIPKLQGLKAQDSTSKQSALD